MNVTMQDPVADMLTRIRNGQHAKHQQVIVPSSTVKEDIVRVLKEEGFIKDFRVDVSENNMRSIMIDLKYFQNKPVIGRIRRISRPGLRVYKSAKELMPIPGYGIAIMSTSKGVMTDKKARQMNVGGEILLYIY